MPETVTIELALKRGKEFLKSKDIESFSIDAELLLMRAAGVKKTELATKNKAALNGGVIDDYNLMLGKRALHMPVQYILNRSEFMSLEFYVDERALIPRPDGEILAETVIKHVKDIGSPFIFEIGAGSGCLAVSVAKYCENAVIISGEIDGGALAVAVTNAEKHNVKDRVTFIESDVFGGLSPEYENAFDVIFSNPPYIESGKLSALPPAVKNFEPHGALDGGMDGLDFYREIIAGAGKFLKRNGMLFFEIGCGQGPAVCEMLKIAGFSDIRIVKDLAGLDRVVSAILTCENEVP